MKDMSKEKHGGLSNEMDVVDDKEGRIKGNLVLRLGANLVYMYLESQKMRGERKRGRRCAVFE